MLAQQSLPIVSIMTNSAPRPQFTVPQFPSLSFPPNMASGDFFSQRDSPVPQTQTIHDSVNQTLTQMTPPTRPIDSGWDFL